MTVLVAVTRHVLYDMQEHVLLYNNTRTSVYFITVIAPTFITAIIFVIMAISLCHHSYHIVIMTMFYAIIT